jgi:elongation factor P--(R)-beta-lysine ligase
MSESDWRPTAALDMLRVRAQMLSETRAYFAARKVMEVETPILARGAVTDVHLESLATRVSGSGDYYLQTSPEYAMKRLLAAGSGDIYQIARVFRDGERGAFHNPEFTLIEWYRIGFDAGQLMEEVATLVTRLVTPHRSLALPEQLTYREAVRSIAGIDPLQSSPSELQASLRQHGVSLPVPAPEERDDCLDLLMSTVVGPRLGAGRLTFIHDYPVSQAALARVKREDRAVAERFELYLDGIELANGFHELCDATEQRARFERDLAQRRVRGRSEPPLDERLLAALAAGLPDCSGVAVGFDRVIMAATGARRIDEVIAFPAERA